MARRRWLLGMEPFFEGGWLHRGRRAQSWDVEERLVAVSLLGDVTVDLSATNSLPREVHVNAYAIGRDVDVLLPEGAAAELSGRQNNDHLQNQVTSGLEEPPALLVRITGHTFLGDVKDSTAEVRP